MRVCGCVSVCTDLRQPIFSFHALALALVHSELVGHAFNSCRRPAAALIAALSASSVLLGLVFASTRYILSIGLALARKFLFQTEKNFCVTHNPFATRWPTRGGRVELDGPGAEVEVPTKLLVAIKRDLASDSLNMVALKVVRLCSKTCPRDMNCSCQRPY